MKTITNGIIAKIFANYVDNTFLGTHSLGNEHRILNYHDIDNIRKGLYSKLHIELVSLENISYSDAVEVDRIEEWNGRKTEHLSQVKIMIYNGIIHNRGLKINSYQFLQSKGYALPYLDYSVEDLVELGVYKLK